MHGPTLNGAQGRGLFALATAVGALVALAIMAGASWSATGSSSASQYAHKVTICHLTHSKKHPQETITVDQHAVKAHLKHGDTLGACTSSKPKKHEGDEKSKKGDKDDDDNTSTEPTATTTSSTDGSSSSSDHGKGHGGDSHGNGNSQSHGGGHSR